MLEYKKMAVAGAALALATVFGTNAARAGVVLDANYTPAQNVYGMSLGSLQPVAQTFTVQHTGVLSAAAVKMESVNGPNQAYGGGVTLEITKTVGGLPSLSAADILGSATIATNFFPIEGQGGYSFINFEVPNIGVTAGEELAIQLFSTANGYFGVNGDLGGCCGPDGSYAGGQGLLAKLGFNNNGQILVTGWQQPEAVPADFAFQTFVTPSACRNRWCSRAIGLGVDARRRIRYRHGPSA